MCTMHQHLALLVMGVTLVVMEVALLVMGVALVVNSNGPGPEGNWP